MAPSALTAVHAASAVRHSSAPVARLSMDVIAKRRSLPAANHVRMCACAGKARPLSTLTAAGHPGRRKQAHAPTANRERARINQSAMLSNTQQCAEIHSQTPLKTCRLSRSARSCNTILFDILAAAKIVPPSLLLAVLNPASPREESSSELRRLSAYKEAWLNAFQSPGVQRSDVADGHRSLS